MSKTFFRSFFQDSGIYLIPTILSQGVAFFLVPLYTRVLSPADYGAIDMIKTFSSFACLFVALEISQAYGRFYVEEENIEDKKLISSTALTFTILMFLLFLTTCQIFTPFFSKILFGNSNMDIYFRIGTIFITMKGVTLLLNTQFRYEFKKINYVYSSIILFSTTSFFSVLLGYIFNWGLIGMLYALLIGQFAALLFSTWKQRFSNNILINKNLLLKMLKFSSPLVPAGVAVFISGYISRIMINHYLSLTEVGLYGIGFRIASISILLISGVNRSLSPLIYSKYKEKETPFQIQKTFRIFIALSLIMFYGLSSFSSELLWLFTTPKYYASSSIVFYLVPALLLSQLYIFFPGLGIAKKTKISMWISIGNAILTTLLNWFLIPLMGYSGAAIATLISCFSTFIIRMKVSQKYYYIPIKWVDILLATVFIGLITFFTSNMDKWTLNTIIIKILIGLSLFPILIKTNLIHKEEYRKLINFLNIYTDKS